MNASVLFNNIVGTLLLPPFNFILLCALGLLLIRKHPRFGIGLSAAALLLLSACSTYLGAQWLARPLEDMNPPLRSTRHLDAQAIVILAGGRQTNAVEYGGQDVPNLITLGRIRYGARVQRATGLPLLVSGGKPESAEQAESALAATMLREELNVPVRWLEQGSDNTAQNAQYSAHLLQQEGIRKVVLVTDALHMPRARRAFEQQGLQVVAAPTVFYSHGRLTPMSWLPTQKGMQLSYYAMHEWLGLLWYRLHRQNPPTMGQAS